MDDILPWKTFNIHSKREDFKVGDYARFSYTQIPELEVRMRIGQIIEFNELLDKLPYINVMFGDGATRKYLI